MTSYESDSDAPEDVAFSTTKEHVLREFEITKNERQREDNSKEWRKTRDAMYKEQKKKKVLSMTVLAKAEDELNENRVLAKKQKRCEEDEDEEASDGGFSDIDSSDEEPDNAMTEDAVNEYEYSLKSDEETPRITVQVLDKNEAKSMLQTALDFRSNALYGESIKRQSMAEYQQQRKKIRVFKNRPYDLGISTKKSKGSRLHKKVSRKSKVRKRA